MSEPQAAPSPSGPESSRTATETVGSTGRGPGRERGPGSGTESGTVAGTATATRTGAESATGSGAQSQTGQLSGPREPQWRVARWAIGLWTVQAIMTAVIFLIPVTIASVLIPASAARWLIVATDLLPWALAFYFVVEILALPRYKYAVHRWEVTADGVYTLTGWLSRTWILVPISRIQTVDVTRGPLQRMFGLASVSVRTASAHGSVEIHQLDAYTAAQVADDLSKRANLYDDDAT